MLSLSRIADAITVSRLTLDTSFRCLAASLRGRLDAAEVDRLLAEWSSALVAHAGMKLAIEGREKVDWSHPYIVMSNHQSLYDIPVLFQAVPTTMRMVAKKELFRVPVWGRAMRAAGIIEIDRQDRKKAIASLSSAGDALKRGVSIWISPEGTRSLDGRLLPFKKGGFVMAMETKAPILPIAVDGTRHILEKHTKDVKKGQTVAVTFGAPIDPAGRTREDLIAEVRRFLEKNVHGSS
jgi:1-acyl-sn-glycerol-3-phosphate acyltransferase